jgi:hypothetical protein
MVCFKIQLRYKKQRSTQDSRTCIFHGKWIWKFSSSITFPIEQSAFNYTECQLKLYNWEPVLTNKQWIA